MNDQDSLQQSGAPTPPTGHSARGTAGIIGLGVALVIAPVGAYGGYKLYKYLEKTSDAKDRALAKAFTYDLTELRKVDASLIKYREVRRIETNMQSPRAIAMEAGGALLVAGDRLVRRFTTSGGFSDVASLSQAPFCLASAPDGTILVGMKDHVEIYGPDGKQKAVWNSFGQRSYLTCIAVAGDSVWVADAGRRLVMRCNWDGKVLQEIGKPDESHGYQGLIVPSPHLDVAVGADGLVWISNPGLHRLEAYSPSGQLERHWGMAGTAIEEFFGCCNPTDFALLSDGSIITAEKGIPRIKHYHTDGRLESVVAAPTAFSAETTGMDLATNVAGQILVLERGTRAVRVFEPTVGGSL